MSDENKPVDKPAPAAKPPAPEPEPIALGPVGQLLQSWNITPLGTDAVGHEAISVPAGQWLAVADFLKTDSRCRFDLLVSIAGVDRKTHREAVYHLYSTQTHQTLVVKVDAIDDHIPSVMPVWHAADWHEREAYDLMGILFDGREGLERILMPLDWLGHPLRKDYVVNDPRLVWNER